MQAQQLYLVLPCMLQHSLLAAVLLEGAGGVLLSVGNKRNEDKWGFEDQFSSSWLHCLQELVLGDNVAHLWGDCFLIITSNTSALKHVCPYVCWQIKNISSEWCQRTRRPLYDVCIWPLSSRHQVQSLCSNVCRNQVPYPHSFLSTATSPSLNHFVTRPASFTWFQPDCQCYANVCSPNPGFQDFFFWLLSLLTESLAAPVWTSPGRLLITISVYMSHLHVFLPTQHMDVGFSGRGKKNLPILSSILPHGMFTAQFTNTSILQQHHSPAVMMVFFFSLCKEFRKLLGNVHLIMQHTFLLSLLLSHSYTRTHSQLHSLSCLTCLP